MLSPLVFSPGQTTGQTTRSGATTVFRAKRDATRPTRGFWGPDEEIQRTGHTEGAVRTDVDQTDRTGCVVASDGFV